MMNLVVKERADEGWADSETMAPDATLRVSSIQFHDGCERPVLSRKGHFQLALTKAVTDADLKRGEREDASGKTVAGNAPSWPRRRFLAPFDAPA